MTGAAIPTLAAMLLQLALGLAVYLANRKRLSNQCFLLFSVSLVGWLGGLLLAFNAQSVQMAEFAIRQASVGGAMYLISLNILRISVRHREEGWRGILRRSKTWVFATIAIVVLCQTKYFPENGATR